MCGNTLKSKDKINGLNGSYTFSFNPETRCLSPLKDLYAATSLDLTKHQFPYNNRAFVAGSFILFSDAS